MRMDAITLEKSRGPRLQNPDAPLLASFTVCSEQLMTEMVGSA